MENLGKSIKTSQNPEFYKEAAYNKLDNMLVDNKINFSQYNKLSDFIEMDSKRVLSSLFKIEKNYVNEVKVVKSGAFEGFFSFINSIKNFIASALSFITIQDKKSKDLNEAFDRILEEDITE